MSDFKLSYCDFISHIISLGLTEHMPKGAGPITTKMNLHPEFGYLLSTNKQMSIDYEGSTYRILVEKV